MIEEIPAEMVSRAAMKASFRELKVEERRRAYLRPGSELNRLDGAPRDGRDVERDHVITLYSSIKEHVRSCYS